MSARPSINEIWQPTHAQINPAKSRDGDDQNQMGCISKIQVRETALHDPRRASYITTKEMSVRRHPPSHPPACHRAALPKGGASRLTLGRSWEMRAVWLSLGRTQRAAKPPSCRSGRRERVIPLLSRRYRTFVSPWFCSKKKSFTAHFGHYMCCRAVDSRWWMDCSFAPDIFDSGNFITCKITMIEWRPVFVSAL
jgi:hypothetical protein